MAQRISRAKKRLDGVALDEPGDLTSVLKVLYLIFNEGYTGDVDLAAEAIRLTRRLVAVTDDPRSAACSACCCSTTPAGRRAGPATAGRCRWPTRTGAAGTPR